MSGFRKACVASVVAAATMLGASSAHAVLIDSWKVIEDNSPIDLSNQFTVDVTNNGSGTAKFRFENHVGLASSITAIYFDDKSNAVLTPTFSLSGSTGVSFSKDASPGNLPGGNAPTVGFSADHSADSDTPMKPQNGINAAGEWLDVVFNLAGGKTFDDLLAELENGELVIGLHIQALSDGKSESYINNPPTNDPSPVPEPATLALFGAGLLGLGALGRRRKSA